MYVILELRNIIDDEYTLRDFEIDEVKYLLHNIYIYAIMYGVMFCLMYMYAPYM